MQESEDAFELTFSGVTVLSAQKVFVIGTMDNFLEEQPNHSLVLRWAEGDWSQIPVVDRVISSCFVVAEVPTLVNVCANGHVELLLTSGTSSEIVDPSDDGPNYLMTLRNARTIGGKVHAAGMARRVYRRNGPGGWQPIDDGLFLPARARTQAAGFLAIDGFGLNDVYTAGYRGEIWHYDGQKWISQESPSGVTLTTMRCDSDGFVYIAGLVGVIIRGRAGEWEVIQQDVTSEDFWGSAIFNGVPYFATNRAVYRLLGDKLERVNLGTKSRVTTRFLDSNSEVMWSVGDKHIFATRDGFNWDAIQQPSQDA